ncbi:hypothetical protein LTR56_015112 [Elasticomyces elasticus]|nr:hypothetical protein LTR56_015112 [Elasticomyces elasticus]KAK3651955.1 hypothetical protein LTR22_011885 [Elasticomyces elasticus]KAK4919093.1 hypothetical protein LTR49_013264 [Elasticomyces elasticus]KAK5765675.1 hypothetical protein LTS12_004181 [Elasticomyces elasticus]
MPESMDDPIAKLQLSARTQRTAFENLRQRRSAFLHDRQQRLLMQSLKLVASVQQLVDTVSGCGNSPAGWTKQRAMMDACCDGVRTSWTELNTAFNITLETYDDLANQLKKLHNDRCLRDLAEIKRLKSKAEAELRCVRDRASAAQNHVSCLEERITKYAEQMEQLDETFEEGSKTASRAQKSSWVCLGAGLGCLVVGGVFPPAGLGFWPLMCGSYTSSAVAFAKGSECTNINKAIAACVESIEETLRILEALHETERELAESSANLDGLLDVSDSLLQDSDEMFQTTRTMEAELLGDHDRSLFFVLESCRFAVVRDTISASSDLQELKQACTEFGNDFIQAARQVHGRSLLEPAARKVAATALTKLEAKVNGLNGSTGGIYHAFWLWWLLIAIGSAFVLWLVVSIGFQSLDEQRIGM